MNADNLAKPLFTGSMSVDNAGITKLLFRFTGTAWSLLIGTAAIAALFLNTYPIFYVTKQAREVQTNDWLVIMFVTLLCTGAMLSLYFLISSLRHRSDFDDIQQQRMEIERRLVYIERTLQTFAKDPDFYIDFEPLLSRITSSEEKMPPKGSPADLMSPLVSGVSNSVNPSDPHASSPIVWEQYDAILNAIRDIS